jgi:hypothetical protein
MKEFDIEDLENEEINVIQLEKVFHITNKENKAENKLVAENNFIGLRIFTNKIDGENLNNDNLKYLNTNEKAFKRNFLDTLIYEKVIQKNDNKKNNESNNEKANDKSKYDVLYFYKLYIYKGYEFYCGLKSYLYLEIVKVRDLKNGLFSIPVLPDLTNKNIKTIQSKNIELEILEDIKTNYKSLVRLMTNYGLKVLNEKSIDLFSKEIYDNLKSEINECTIKPYELKSLANIEKDIEKEIELEKEKAKKSYYDDEDDDY